MVGVIAAITGHYGFELNETAVMAMLSPLLVYVVAQGSADRGKEERKLELKYREDRAKEN